MRLYDTITVDDSSVRTTKDGYLVASVRAARTGIQEYSAAELGLKDRKSTDVIRVYRPPEVVFNKDALASIAHRPLTNDHPTENVTAANWKKLATGQLGDEVMKDGNFVRVPMVMMDAAAISDYRRGKKELSLGYDAEIEFRDGISPENEPFDAVMTDYSANHLAQCWGARGGHELRIGDNSNPNPGERKVTTRTMIVDGLAVEVTDAAALAIEKLQKTVSDANAAHAVAIAAKDAQIGTLTATVATKDGEIAGLTSKLADAAMTPQKLDDAVRARAAVVDAARALVGDTFVADGKTDLQIMKEAVTAKVGDTAATLSDEGIAAAFKVLTPAKDADTSTDTIRDAVRGGAGQITDSEKKAQAARQAMIDSYNPKSAAA